MSSVSDLFENRNAVVTGGVSGISYAICESLLNKNIKKLAIIDINSEQGIEVVNILNSKYGADKVIFVKCDIGIDKSVDEAFDFIIKEFEAIDFWVNGAGVVNESKWQICLKVNLLGLLYASYKAWNHMRVDEGGRGGAILNIASIYGLHTKEFIPAYHASKYGVVGFSKSLGSTFHYERTKVRVLTLCPGMTSTNITLKIEDMLDCETGRRFENSLKDDYVFQSPDYVAMGAIDVFEKGQSGSVWVAEESQPAYEIQF